MWRLVVHFGFALVLAGTASGQQADDPSAPGGEAMQVDYLRDIKPILSARCYSCHGALAQQAGLRLDTGALIRQGSENGAVVTPGKPQESALLERVQSSDDSLRMPPQGKPLTGQEIDKLQRWISLGADSPPEEQPEANPRDHWAFRPIVRPPLPDATGDWGRNLIDRYIAAEWPSRSLTPVGEASPETLLRRVYLDLIGIPPSREELRDYLAETARLGEAAAYERQVERLLASPKYGERWGRHWMDVWRYSDWYGRRAVPDVMNSYPHVWRWRDWIVRSLNEDRGYDWMVRQMLAADEITPTDDANIVATGFLVRNWFKWNYEQWMKDNVEHTGKAFLGLTLNCAHCHDHKYDPITQEEYFRFRAFFEPLELRQDRVPGLPDPGAFEKYVYAKAYGPIAAGMIRVFDEKLEAETFMYSGGDSRNRIPNRPPVSPAPPAILGGEGFSISPVELPVEAFYPGAKPFIRQEETAKATAAASQAESAQQASRQRLVEAERALADVQARAALPASAAAAAAPGELVRAMEAALDARIVCQIDEARSAQARASLVAVQSRLAADDARFRQSGDAAAAARAAALAEKRLAYETACVSLATSEQALVTAERKAAGDAAAQPEAAKAREQLNAARAAVDAARTALAAPGETYQPFSPVYPQKSTGRRKALAEWITSRDNPLTARVAVNHIWLRHFGRAIVPTTSNFGRQGKPPSHPALLDYLAAELIDSGWSMKHLHRLIVTSAVYRLRSSADASTTASAQIDPENQWYWRASARRMEAEAVRDSVLACSLSLDETIGGQELDHALGLSQRRRSLYFASHGESQMEFLTLFDGPNVNDCYERSSSVLPQQSLAMVNSDLVQAHSRRLAEVLSSAADDEPSFVIAAFQQILTREPSAAELAASGDFLARQRQLFQSDPSTSLDGAASDLRARQSLVRVLFSHNDFVTIR